MPDITTSWRFTDSRSSRRAHFWRDSYDPLLLLLFGLEDGGGPVEEPDEADAPLLPLTGGCFDLSLDFASATWNAQTPAYTSFGVDCSEQILGYSYDAAGR